MVPSVSCLPAICLSSKGISNSKDSLCRLATVKHASVDARILSTVFDASKALVIVPVDSFSFSLVDPTLRLELHRKRNNVVVISAMINPSDDLLPAHWALGDAFAGLGTLILTSYQGFHEACVAEQVTAVGSSEVFHGLHANYALQCRQFHGLVGLLLLCIDRSHPLLLENFGKACLILYVL